MAEVSHLLIERIGYNMSASRSKRLRKSTTSTATTTVAASAKKKGLGKTGQWIIGIVCAVLAAAIIAGSALVSSTFFNSRATAVTVGEHKITPAEYSMYYREVYYEYYQAYGSSDGGASLMSYMTSSIEKATLDRINQTYAIYDAAVAAGRTLSAESRQAIDDEIAEYAEYAEMFGMKNTDEIIASMFGAGCTEKVYRNYMEIARLAGDYSNEIMDAYQPTNDELEAYYTEHQDEFDTVSFRQFYVTAGTERTIDEAKKIAEEMAAESAKDESKFGEYAVKYAAENRKAMYEANPDLTRIPDVELRNTNPATTEWLSDHSRKAADTAFFPDDDDAGYYVVYFIARNGHTDEHVADLRTITLSVGADAVDDDWAAAKLAAEDLLAEFMAGEKTEEAFAALADSHNSDGSVGGLTEDVYPGEFGDEMDAFCFDKTASAGETAIIRTEDSCKLVYFSGYGETYRAYLAHQELNSIYQQDWLNTVKVGHEAQTKAWGMRFVDTEISTSLF